MIESDSKSNFDSNSVAMGQLFDKYSKILQLNRALIQKNYKDAQYIGSYATENILERWHVSQMCGIESTCLAIYRR